MFAQRILHYQFGNVRKIALIFFCWILVGLIGVLHFITGAELVPHSLFLIPVIVVSWYAGTRPALFTLLLCAASWLFAEISLAPFQIYMVINEAIRMSVFLLLTLSIIQLRIVLARERRLARIDGLTGLLNRRAFYEACQMEIVRAKRYHHPLSIMMIDLDNFKQVNDQFGHAAGDELLATISSVIRDDIRASDTPGRLGGDEFTVLLPETSEAAARIIVNKLHGTLLDAIQKRQWLVTVSIGVATFNDPPEDADILLKHADDLMYAVKQSGKNGIRCETISMGR